MNADRQVLMDFIKRYGPEAGSEGPLRMVREVLKISPDPWQVDVLRDFAVGERRISLRACHGPGKTAVIAWCIINQLICRFPQKTVATAPSRGQLFDALFAEVASWLKKTPQAIQDLYEIKADRIELKAAKEDSFFSARTARRENPEALQGVHSAHVLLVADEGSGVEEAIYESAVGSMSGHNATTILASNPTKTSGFFFDTQNKLKRLGPEDKRPGTWKCYHIGAHNSPRVTKDFMEDVAARYGEDSDAYRIRVLGEFPKTDSNTVIPFYLVEEAAARTEMRVFESDARVWGVDVARFGEDLSVLLERTPRVITSIEEFRKLDLMQLVGKIKHKWDTTLPSLQPEEIAVDLIGLGAGVYDRLRELDLPAIGVNVSESAAMSETYINLRAELWFKMREWLEQKGCHIPPEYADLRSELVLPRYEFTSSGKIKLESKESLKKRGHRSPNYADSLALTFSTNAVKATMGRASRRGGKALKRNLPNIV